MVGTGLERDIGRCSAGRFAGRLKGGDLGMCITGERMPTLAHHFAIPYEDAADHGVGVGAVATTRRQLECPRHVRAIGAVEHRQVFFLPRSSGSSDICSRLAAVSEMRCRRLISSSNSVMSWKRRYTEANRT